MCRIRRFDYYFANLDAATAFYNYCYEHGMRHPDIVKPTYEKVVSWDNGKIDKTTIEDALILFPPVEVIEVKSNK